MQRVVMKFGGASVATPRRMTKVAQLIAQKKAEGKEVIVVVSAMGDTTNKLLALSKKICDNPPKREHDMLVSVGERISMALLAMALKNYDVEAISFTGSQSGIITCESHTQARILDVRPKRLLAELAKGKVVIVAGFQGVSLSGEITTLGRNGSDTTAVALAIALTASVEFYKDVKGIYARDPKKDPNAHFFSSLTYDQALLIAQSAPVLQPRCLKLALKNRIPLKIVSFQSKAVGTLIEDGALPPATVQLYEECDDIDH